MPTNLARSASTYLTDLGRLFEGVRSSTPTEQNLSVDVAVDAVVQLLVGLRSSGKKAMLIGNGGSAAIVSHMQNDLFKMLGVRAMVFTEQPLLTALANDDGYETVFCQPVDRWADVGDLLFAVSSSGESNSIITAVAAARNRGCEVVTLSGFNPDNRLRQLGDVNLYVPHFEYGYVEMTHAVLLHCVADIAMTRKAAGA